ncbi:hypothetical protein [Saccharopolyspora griseoalba]|uniref:Uncharacterized protein n=1 Tax=Saccharopolyspora griseoalba TaxID=1431848 RepID=A0ABW2LTM0_9PSEU
MTTTGDRPDCGGLVIEHIDDTVSACSRGSACTGGGHTEAEECHGFPERCDYCLTLRCEHAVIEHANGAEECRVLGADCPGAWHDGELIACEDVYGNDHTCPPAV